MSNTTDFSPGNGGIFGGQKPQHTTFQQERIYDFPVRITLRPSTTTRSEPSPIDVSKPPSRSKLKVAPDSLGEFEETLIHILEAPLPAYETASNGYRLKEEALGFVMSKLTLAQSRLLYRRLATPIASDVLATSFTSRLTGERRNRLLAFLGDARRRRQALATR